MLHDLIHLIIRELLNLPRHQVEAQLGVRVTR